MVVPGSCEHCAACGGRSWHGPGPAVVVHPGDGCSTRIVAEVVRQCELHRMETLVVTYDEVPPPCPWAFTTIFLVLSGPSTGAVASALEICRQLLKAYRAKRRNGLAEVSSRSWYLRGVANLIGHQVVDERHHYHPVFRMADAWFSIEDGLDDLLLDPCGHMIDPEEPTPEERTGEGVFIRLENRWGVRREDVRGVRRIIDSLCESREGAGTLIGATFDVDVLVQILQHGRAAAGRSSTGSAQADHLRLMSAGNRVCHRMFDEIQENFAHVDRYGGGNRLLQKDLQGFYRLLRVAERQLGDGE